MSDLIFILYSLKARWLNCLLSVLLTASGICIAFLITQLGNHIQERLNKDGKGIDIVVGAKGSPLQLILSSIYHFDVPTGNIPYSSALELMKHPQIKYAIPLALGDNWKGHRIVGTTTDYITHYNAEINEGEIWQQDFEIVVGASVNLKIDEEILGSHGLLDEGSIHQNHKYKVKGILKPSSTVLDRLILTSVDSVLKIHGLESVGHNHVEELNSRDKNDHEKHNHEKHNHNEEDDNHHSRSGHKENEHNENDNHENETAHKKHSHEPHEDEFIVNESKASEITALLITTKSPIANLNLPRNINRKSLLQAANPAVEMTRFTTMLGLGSKSFAVLSFILIIIASLSIFSGLAANLENRLGDLAILRAIGYTKNRIFKIICIEGLFLIVSGIIIGFVLGFFLFNLFVQLVAPLNITQASLSFSPNLIFLTLSVLLSGFIASFFPAYRASKISVANQLSRDI